MSRHCIEELWPERYAYNFCIIIKLTPCDIPQLQALSKYMEATKDLKILLEVDPNNSAARQEFNEVKQLWEKKLREIQLQQKTAKATPTSQKTKSGKSGGSSKKKSSQKKSSKDSVRSNPVAELQKTKSELEKLLQETTKLKEESKKQAEQPNQMRKSELEKLIKETKAKAKAAASDQPPPTPTATSSKVQGQEKSPDIVTKEKSESEDHLTASKTTYYKEKGKEEKDAETSPSKTDVPLSEEAGLSSPSEGKEESAGGSKRKRIVIEEGPESDEDEAEPTPAQTTQQSTDTISNQQQTEEASQDVKQPTLPATKAKEKLVSLHVYMCTN